VSADALIDDLEGRGVRLFLDGGRLRFKAPGGVMTDAVRARISERRDSIIAALKERRRTGPEVVADPTARHAPFPQTDLQQAYWVGEEGLYKLSTPAFLHHEWAVPALDAAALEKALSVVARRHEMLRVVPRDDGSQAVPPEVTPIPLTIEDRRGLDSQTAEAAQAERRSTIDRHLSPIDGGAQLTVVADRYDDGWRVHLLMRLFVFDGRSLDILGATLAEALASGADPAEAAPQDLSYADCQRAIAAFRDAPAWRRAWDYWAARADSLPGAPELPVAEGDRVPGRSRFGRRQVRLDGDAWTALEAGARGHGLSINAVLASAYAESLRRWSAGDRFCINVMSARRPGGHPQVAQVLGNFGSTLLLEVPEGTGSFAERTARLQAQLHADMTHAAVSGIEVARALRRGAADPDRPAAPVVFASGLGLGTAADDRPTLERLGWRRLHGRMHTPQVWLDHQVYPENEDIVLNWDYAEGVFADGVVDGLVDAWGDLIDRLRRDETAWRNDRPLRLPTPQLAPRRRANATEGRPAQGRLADRFEAVALPNAARPALIAPDRTLSYASLERLTARLAARLQDLALDRDDLIGVAAPKGWRQIAATLAIARSGAAYLPIGSTLPVLRKAHLIAASGARAVLAEGDSLKGVDVPAGVVALDLDEALAAGDPGPAPRVVNPAGDGDLAYVIYTSGSTGTPKGVAIEHKAAMNTIDDCIARFGLGPEDRVIQLSALNFDLSVYDIFGALGTGAGLVIPPPSSSPDPEGWAECVARHRVTVWNSVPALMDMTLEALGDRAAERLASLRLVMLSGDWVPLGLPDRLRAAVPGVRLIALGGATETSIWSNWFEVERVEPGWASIPYGVPLTNQRFHVLDGDLEHRPVWVPGDLYIAGDGLARNYHRDPERTAASFFDHPVTGERLYRTGDKGRYRPDGLLEFLGRDDGQVKIRGFRIELGEIEAALARAPGVRRGVAVVRASGGDRRVAAFVVADEGRAVDLADLRRSLEERLPDYMVPATIDVLDALPVTANGKIDRKALVERTPAEATDAIAARVAPRDTFEQALHALWADLLGTPAFGVTDDFFALGGTSLTAVRLMNRIAEAHGTRLALPTLFRAGTVAAQAALLRERKSDAAPADESPAVVPIRPGSADAPLVLLVHPVGGNVLCYRGLADRLAADRRTAAAQIVGLQSPGTGADRTIDGLARGHVAALVEAFGPEGLADRPVVAAGWSLGGVVATAMARLLEETDVAVAGVVLVDSWTGAPDAAGDHDGAEALTGFFTDFCAGRPLPAGVSEAAALPAGRRVPAALEAVVAAGLVAADLDPAEIAHLYAEYRANYTALMRHVPSVPAAPTTYFRATGTPSDRFPGLVPLPERVADLPGFGRMAAIPLDADHFTAMQPPALDTVAAAIAETAGARRLATA